MRSTVRIDDDLMVELRARASEEGISLTRLFNRVLRAGMAAPQRDRSGDRPYRQRTFAMGPPLVGLDKALALSDRLEEEEAARKLSLRK